MSSPPLLGIVADSSSVCPCAGARSSPVAAQTYCDPNYGGCVPGDRDYDCWELHDMGIGDIPVIGTDWQRLDG